MDIGPRLRQLREQKGLSQGDIEETAGLLRTYVSRVENGHIVPTLETLERFAAVLDVPMYRLFYTAAGPPSNGNLARRKTLGQMAEEEGKERVNARFLLKLKGHTSKIVDRDREVLLALAKRLATT
jgi:transcriptional regulator with XRE-family HTH domain